MGKPAKTFSNLTLIVIGPVLAQLNPILPKQPLNKYEGARIKLGQQKSCLTQSVNPKAFET